MPGRGRPRENVTDKVDVDEVERLAAGGLTDTQVGIALGLSQRTINYYKKNKEFLAAYKKGRERADTKVVESLYKRALGYQYEELHTEIKRNGKKEEKIVKKVIKEIAPDVTACIFYLKNRQKDEWRDVNRQEHELINPTTWMELVKVASKTDKKSN